MWSGLFTFSIFLLKHIFWLIFFLHIPNRENELFNNATSGQNVSIEYYYICTKGIFCIDFIFYMYQVKF